MLRPMRMNFAVVAALCLLATSGCAASATEDSAGSDGPSASPDGAATAAGGATCENGVRDAFKVEPVPSDEAESTPVRAAEAFVRRGEQWTEPRDGWQEIAFEDGLGVIVRSEDSILRVVLVPGDGYVVTSGQRCVG